MAVAFRTGLQDHGSFAAELHLDRPKAVMRREQTVSAADTSRVAIPRASGPSARLVRIVR